MENPTIFPDNVPASYLILPEGILPGDFIDSPPSLHIFFAFLLGGSTRQVCFVVSNKIEIHFKPSNQIAS